ncbi:glycosyltransferase [Christiangramia fulva]|uniref:Glycosyltransferase n=1 Tax=Christiangramia fulva TaxID=2126553 RepID=A0A2R3Z7T0_9FLAO|nr:glycosyltransferase [Christiangramia fulva]AVR46329.1 glycosyltransferase [Christiangramia fulva]
MKKILIIGYVWPEPSSSAAGSRMIQLLDFFLLHNFEITFATPAVETGNQANLKTKGISTRKIVPNDPAFDNFLEELKPEIVLFDRFMMEEQFGWRVEKVCPDTLKILDTEDLHFLRNARQEAWKKGCDEKEIYKNSELAKREIASIYRCDLSFIISKAEMDLLTGEFNVPGNLLYYLPLLFETSEIKEKALPGYEERKGFMHIGNFLHEPNWNAVLYLKEKLWPGIRKKMPSAEVFIYGSYPSRKVWNLHKPEEGFHIMGKAEEAENVFQQARILLAPLQFGAGLKGKLLEAMQNGTPSITTPVGAEGISDEAHWPGTVCRTDEDFIEKSVAVYSNAEKWIFYQKQGYKILMENFEKSAFLSDFQERILGLQNNLKKHREMNFTGQMLKFHLHKSTYYLSRFIEEKNRKK